MKKVFSCSLLIMIFISHCLYSQSWIKIHTPEEKNFLYDVKILPGEVLAVDDILGVWISPDYCNTWNRTLNTYNVLRMEGKNSLYALGGIYPNAFIYESNPGGTSWTDIAKPAITRPYAVAIAVKNTDELFVIATQFLSESPLLFKTTDHGNTWDSIGYCPYLQTIIPGSGDYLYGLQLYGAEGTNGFYLSTDGGQTWAFSMSGISSQPAALVARGENDLFISASEGKLYKSTDKGISWESVTNSFPDTSTLSNLSLSLSGDLFLVEETSDSKCKIHISSDEGVTWQQVGEPVEDADFKDLEITSRNTVIFLADYDLYTNDPLYLTSGLLSDEVLPLNFGLDQNYPNPFNPNTIIKYQIPVNGLVSLKIYDILGKEISTLVNEEKSAGRYEVNFNASDLASGVYIYRVKVNEFVESKKMVLIK